MLIDVSILGKRKVLFEGTAESVIVPGEQGVLEVLPFHKTLVSRLVAGNIQVDQKRISIKRGLIKVYENKVNIIAEES